MERVLNRKKFDRYIDRESRKAFVALMLRTTHLFAMQEVDVAAARVRQSYACRDPGDVKFLALALTAEAHAIVSGDEDLLVLHPWRGIPIMRAAEFLRLYPPEGRLHSHGG